VKKTSTLTVITLLAGAVSAYSQGIVQLNDTGTGLTIQVFGPQPLANSPVLIVDGAYSGYEEMGDTINPNSGNPGSTFYTAANPLGNGYTVQLMAAGGTTATQYSQLSPVGDSAGGSGRITTWGTGNYLTAWGGFWNTEIYAIVPDGTADVVAIAAWNNEGGTVTSLLQAQQAGDPWGLSAMETASVVPASSGFPPPYLDDPPITSFSLVAVPEPSTIALGVMGVSALLIRRRK
jgi:hypothetical protein